MPSAQQPTQRRTPWNTGAQPLPQLTPGKRTTPWDTGAPPLAANAGAGALGAAAGGALANLGSQVMVPQIDTGYIDQFNGSLGSARGMIDTQLAQGLASLRASSDNSAKVLATLPKALQDSYALAAGQLEGAQQVAGDAVGGAVASPAALAPMSAAISANQAGNAATAPLLDQARLSQQSAGENQLRASAIEAQARLDAEARQAAMAAASMRQEAEMARWQAQREDQQRRQERNWAVEDRDYAAQYERDALETRYADADRERRANYLTESGWSGTPEEYDAILQSPEYKRAVRELTGQASETKRKGWFEGGRPVWLGGDPLPYKNVTIDLSPEDIYKKYGNNPRLLEALLLTQAEMRPQG